MMDSQEFALRNSARKSVMQKVVWEALDNATDNGIFANEMKEHTSDEIAEDLITYCADLEDVSIHDLIPHIDSWKVKS